MALDLFPALFKDKESCFSTIFLFEILRHGQEEADIGLDSNNFCLYLKEGVSLLLHLQVGINCGNRLLCFFFDLL